MLTRYRGSLALKTWALDMPGDQRCARRGPPPEIGGRDELPRGSMTRGREQRTAPILSHGQTTSGQCGFNQAASHPADPIKRHRARRERSHPKAMLTTQTSAVALDLFDEQYPQETLTSDREFVHNSRPTRRLQWIIRLRKATCVIWFTNYRWLSDDNVH